MNSPMKAGHYAQIPQTELDALKANPPITPCGNFLLVRVEDVKETYGESKIVIAANVVDREQKGAGLGYVIAIGPGAWSDCEEGAWCSVGDRVAFQRYEGVVPPIEGLDSGKFRIIADNKVLGVVR